MSWFLGLLVSGSVWITLNSVWPPPGLREVDEKDVFGTFAHSSIISEDIEARFSEDGVKEAGKA
jgi:NCS1 family nucleobase:cation symporter-1